MAHQTASVQDENVGLNLKKKIAGALVKNKENEETLNAKVENLVKDIDFQKLDNIDNEKGYNKNC